MTHEGGPPKRLATTSELAYGRMLDAIKHDGDAEAYGLWCESIVLSILSIGEGLEGIKDILSDMKEAAGDLIDYATEGFLIRSGDDDK